MLVTIPIPEGTKCLLKPGEDVELGHPYLKTGKDVTTTIPLSQKLGVSSSKIFRYMKKLVGDPIEKGEIIATKKTLLSEVHIKSENTGIIKEINHYEGTIVIVEKGEEHDIIGAFFKGTVEHVRKNEIDINLNGAKEFEVKKPLVSFGGHFILLESDKIAEMQDTVIFAESMTTYVLAKSEAMGANGYVTLTKVDTSLPSAQLKNIDDAKKIASLTFPYCLIDSASSKLYLYK